jgi:hypothetical protein
MLEFLKMAPQKPKRQTPDPAAPRATKTASSVPQYRNYPPQPVGPPEVVSPIWLVKAFAIMIMVALVCGYACLCLLLYQGEWQLILHPKQTSTMPASIAEMPVKVLHFGMDESGKPQLTGWSVAAAPGARYAGLTVLYLPSGDGSLVDSVSTLAMLHELGVNVFAFDYRGYGQSVAVHPNQARMMQDADWAFEYLTRTRGVPEQQIAPYGVGVGTSMATHLAAIHAGIPALILDSPGTDPLAIVLADPRTKYLPVRALMHDSFPLAGPLATLKTPKLLFEANKGSAAFSTASDPKVIVSELTDRTNPRYPAMMTEYLSRFFDQHLPATPAPQMKPK